MFGRRRTRRRLAVAAALAFIVPAVLTACDDDPLFELLPDPPAAPTNVQVSVDGSDATVTWAPGGGATEQRVTLTSAGQPDDVTLIGDNVTSSVLYEDLVPAAYTATVTAVNRGGETNSSPRSFSILPPVTAPTLDAFGEVTDDRTSLVATWTIGEGAENWDVVLTPDDGSDPIEDRLPASATTATFGPPAYVIHDEVTYTAQVFPVRASARVEEEGSNTLTYLADTHDWDTYFPTSLHETGAGKTTFYDVSPNRGFEVQTGVPYANLACIGCHSAASGLAPVSGRTCDRCHTEEKPEIGSVVDSGWDTGVCLGCHSRQTLEVNLGYSDVHRDAGFDCMDCHTLGDVHGDGTEYEGLMDIGAIDASCDDCHNAESGFTHPAGTDPHGGAVACAACHAQSAVTCNNCHFEAQVENTGKFFKTPPAANWLWLGNRFKRDGSGETEVYPVNYQSVEYLDATFVAFGFYTPHTIGQGRGCSSCHNNLGGTNEAIIQYNAEGIIDVATWDDATKTLSYPTGVVPMPEDYLESLKFDFVTSPDGGTTWNFLKAGADTIQVLDFWMTPLDVAQMGALGMVAPAP